MDFEDSDKLYEELEKKIRVYRPDEDLSLLHRAYLTAKNAHMDQKRNSGEPYIIHPVKVATILAELGLDTDTVIAGLLHDTVEDTILAKEQLKRVFGEDVALLVDGVTKLTQINLTGDKTVEQAENLRKMFLAMSKDIRVIIVKLADRLHNMRTLNHMRSEKQKEKARETLDIYSPLAQRLGISAIKIELDDLSLKYLEPEVYADLKVNVEERMASDDKYIESIISEVSGYMKEAEIEAEVYGRVKHLFSIYKKMKNQNKTIDQIYDLFAVRIIVDSVKDCYAALGVIHEHYKPIPGRFKDYIAMPKPNMYQSLHTTLIGSGGQPFEIQIRTHEMHRIAEYGIAAHWKYKEAGSKKVISDDDQKMNWLRQILEIQSDTTDNNEFMNVIKTDLDLFSDQVYCFTPNGEVKTLPMGSNPIDFAYAIHSAVGNRMVGARVNGQLEPIDYVLKNGDRVEIMTSQNSKGPSRDWLKIVKSAQAKNKINAWFKSQLKEENIEKGKEMIEKYCKTKGIDFAEINTPEIREKILQRYSYKEWDALVSTIGYGGLKEGQVVNRMCTEYDKIVKKEVTDQEVLDVISEASEKNKVKITGTESGIVVKGIHDLAVRFSRCCSPVPGDEIVGFVTRGRGISVHRTDCVNIMNLPEADRARLIPAEWQKDPEDNTTKYTAGVRIFSNNRIGLLVDISRVFTESGVNIQGLNTHIGKNGVATAEITFDVKNADEIRTITDKLMQIKDIIGIERTTG